MVDGLGRCIAKTALGVVLVTAGLCLGPRTAEAWLYSEHVALTREATLPLCARLTELAGSPLEEATATRVSVAKALLCDQGASMLNMFRYDMNTGCELEPEPRHCTKYRFPEAVALIDNKNNVAVLREHDCRELEQLQGDLEEVAYESLTADDHFHPKVRGGFAEAFEQSRARALLGRTTPGGCPGAFHRALFDLARALHLLEDSFAAGHAATALQDNRDPRTVTYVHDLYNTIGLEFDAPADPLARFTAYGDGQLHIPDNAENRSRVLRAATDVLCTTVADYVGPEHIACAELPTHSVDLVPRPAEDVRPLKLLGGLLFEYGSSIHIWEGPSLVRRTQVSTFGVGFEEPFSARMLLRVGGDFEWFAQRGFSTRDYEEGAMGWDFKKRRLRGAGLKLGLSYSSVPHRRLVRGLVTLDSHTGWWNVDCTSDLLCAFDGMTAGLGAEILMYYITARFSLLGAYRRSATDVDGWDPWLGLSVGVVWPRFNLYGIPTPPANLLLGPEGSRRP